jgi:hypothetical protein
MEKMLMEIPLETIAPGAKRARNAAVSDGAEGRTQSAMFMRAANAKPAGANGDPEEKQTALVIEMLLKSKFMIVSVNGQARMTHLDYARDHTAAQKAGISRPPSFSARPHPAPHQRAC